MTLVIAVEGNDYLVLAADSKGTWIAPDGNRMETTTAEKLVQLSNYACVLIAGEPEIGVQLIEEFKATHKGASKLYITELVKEFSKYCKKEIRHISDSIPTTSKAFPDIHFVIAGMDKKNRKLLPKINILRSQQLFFAGRQKDTVSEGKPFIARYLLSREYNRNLARDDMCYMVAKAMNETKGIDGDVGGEIKMAIIDRNGVRFFLPNAVETFIKGKEEYQKNKIEGERKELKRLVEE